jgi:hypothetical protein
LDGEPTDAPGSGFKMGYSRDYYDRFSRVPPQNNIAVNCLSWGNGAQGLTWGGGNGHRAINCTFWKNERKSEDFGNLNGDDIDMWDPEGGLIKNVLATQVGNLSNVKTEDLMIQSVSKCCIDTATGDTGIPRNPSTFALPEHDSRIVELGVGATRPGTDWVQQILDNSYR